MSAATASAYISRKTLKSLTKVPLFRTDFLTMFRRNYQILMDLVQTPQKHALILDVRPFP